MKNKTFKATYDSKDTPLVIGDIKIPCYIVEDEAGNIKRVFSGKGLQSALGYTKNDSGHALQVFLKKDSLKEVFEDLNEVLLESRIEFKRKGAAGAQSKTFGYEATILIEICNKVLEAREKGLLSETETKIAKNAEIIIRSVAKVGIIALIDEATGYQENREKRELQRLLNEFISEELRPWQKRFPDEFYKQIFRLRGWEYPKPSPKRPGIVGKYTNQYIYNELHPKVLEALKVKNPIVSPGRRNYRHHQYLTTDIGDPALEKQIVKVTTLMQISDSWEEFERNFEKQKQSKPLETEQDNIVKEDN